MSAGRQRGSRESIRRRLAALAALAAALAAVGAARAAPANDNFANAFVLSGTTATVTGSFAGATKETGEPQHGTNTAGTTVWYRWTAPSGDPVTLDTYGSEGWAVVTVYTGSSVSALTQVARGAPPSGNTSTPWETVTFTPTSGTVYSIALDVCCGLYGSGYTLSLNPARPANDGFAQGEAIAGDSGSVTGTNVRATRESGEPAPFATEGFSVWYRWTSPSSGLVTFRGTGFLYAAMFGVSTGDALGALTPVGSSSYPHGSVTFNAQAGTRYHLAVGGSMNEQARFTLSWSRSAPPNDAFASPTYLQPRGSLAGGNSFATKEAGEPAHAGDAGGASVWYRWSASADGRLRISATGASFPVLLAVYTGSAVAALTPAGATTTGTLVLDVLAGTAYSLAVDGAGGATGSYTLEWEPVPPANDAFAAAAEISGTSGTASAGMLATTREPGEPGHEYDGPTVWWQWTPATSGVVAFDTDGSPGDSTLRIFRGSSFDSLLGVAAETDTGTNDVARVTFTFRAGTTYRIQVSTDSRAVLNWRLESPLAPAVPANDAYANARTISGEIGQVRGTTLGATKEPGEPRQAEPGCSVWYRWTASANGDVYFSLPVVEGFPSRLEVFEGGSLAALQGVPDDYVPIEVLAIAGHTYFIRVDSYTGTCGEFVLDWDRDQPPPPNDYFSAAQTLSGDSGAVATTTYNATREVSEPDHGCYSCPGSVWYRWAAPRDGTWTFELDTASGTLAVYTGDSIGTLARATAGSNGRVTFAAAAGTTYSLAVVGGGFHATLAWHPAEAAAVIANDNFANAQALAGDRGSATGRNDGATTEGGEPLHAGSNLFSVWFRWTAPASGTYVFDTFGSAFDTRLAVYSGSTLTTLVRQAENDNAAGTATSVLELGAQAGVTYSIAVAGGYGQAGPLTVNWKLAFTGPANDRFALAQGVGGSSGSVTGSNEGATEEPGEPDHAGQPGGASVWFRWTAPESGPFLFETQNTNVDTLLAVYTGAGLAALSEVASNDDWLWAASRVRFNAVAGTTYSIAVDGWRPGTPPAVDAGPFTLRWAKRPANDDFLAAQPIDGSSGSLAASTVDGTVEEGEPETEYLRDGSSVWFRWTAAASAITTFTASAGEDLYVFTGSTFADLAVVAEDDPYSYGPPTAKFNAAAGTTYLVQVLARTTAAFTLTWRQAAPPNDAFAGPTTISWSLWNGVWVQANRTSGTNAGATTEPGEPAHDGIAGGASVWFTWQAPLDTPVSVDTVGSDFDTVLAVYTGSSLTALAPVAADDDSGGDRTSRATFTATAGTVYRIAVDGKGGATGSIAVTIAPARPANDDFAAAAPLAASGKLTANNNGASKEPGEPNHGGNIGGHSLWYRWTAPADGTYVFDAIGDGFGVLLGVYSGHSVDALEALGGGRGSAYDGTSVRFGATAGQTYMIAIDGDVYGRQTGVITLTWAAAPTQAQTNDQFAGAQTLTGWTGSLSGSNAGATREAGEPLHAWYGTGGWSLWYRWTAPADGAVAFEVEHPHDGVAVEPLVAFYTGTSLGTLTLVSDRFSHVHQTVSGGTTYWIALDSVYSPGTFVLRWRQLSPPANDLFSGAQLLDGDHGSVVGSLVEATRQAGERQHSANSLFNVSVWYRWTAPRSGRVTLDVRPHGLDDARGSASIWVYTGAMLATLERVADSSALWGREPANRVRFDAVAGVSYSIALTRAGGPIVPPPPSFRFNWALPPANDGFADAEPLSGAAGSVVGRNSGASKELSEPDHSGNRGGASVWYRWTAPASETVVFETNGSDHDTLLAVYTGLSVGGLTEVARDDEAGGSPASRVVFDAVSGTTYSIAVDGFYGPYLLELYNDTYTGAIALGWHSVPSNDSFADAETLLDRSGRVAGTTVGAGKEAGEPAHAGDAGGSSVWYAWTAAVAGAVTIDTVGSSFDTLLAVYTGSTPGGLTPVAASDDADGLLTSHVRFRAQAGTTYRIAVDGKGGAVGRLFLSWRLEGAPANDDLANATSITAVRGKADVQTLWATKEPGEPAHAGIAGGASVWFRWVSPISDVVTFETEAYYADTVLAVYTGDTVDALTEVASNDDRRSGRRTSAVSFAAAAGTEYLIAADTRDGVYASFELYWNRPPENDARFAASSFPLEEEAGSTTATNRWATKEAEEKPLAGNAGGASVWFTWRAPATGTVSFDTIGSGFDTLLGIYGDYYYDWTLRASDDDSGGGTASRISFAVTEGAVYNLVVDGKNGASGAIVLNWSLPISRPANDDFANAHVFSGTPASTSPGCVCDNLGATTELGEPDHGGDGHTLWARWTAPASGLVQFTATRGYYDRGRPVVAVYTGSTVSALTEVVRGENGYSDETYGSFRAVAGVTYNFALDLAPAGDGAEPYGEIRVSLAMVATPAQNDDFVAPQAISGDSGTVSGNTTNASREAAEPRIGLGRSVWYRWTPTTSGRVTLEPRDVGGYHYDFPRVGIFTGSSLAALTPVSTTTAPNADWTQVDLIRFTVAAGTTYWIQVDGRSVFGKLEYGAFSLTWSTLAGDSFAGPRLLTGASGTVRASTALATKEPGEPNHAANVGGHSLWFSWTPSAGGAVTFDTAGSTFDTILAVYTGSSIGALTEAAANDDAPGLPTSSLTFEAVAGSQYRIAVDGYSGAAGDAVLRWSLAGAPTDTTAPSVALAAPAEGAYVGRQTTLSAEATDDVAVAEVEFRVGSVSVGVDANAPYSVLWDTTSLPDGPVTITAVAKDTAGNVTTTPARSITLDRRAPITTITQRPQSPTTGPTSTYAFTADEPATFECSLDGQSFTACTSPTSYNGLATGTHSFTVRAIDRAGNVGSVVSEQWFVQGAPANDAFASAQLLAGSSGSASGTTVNATKEAGEPNHGGNAGGASIWFRWTAPASGTVTITTRSSSFDTLLGVYRGSSVSALALVAGNNNETKRIATSKVSFTATAGTSYAIAVDGYRGVTGSVTLSWTGP